MAALMLLGLAAALAADSGPAPRADQSLGLPFRRFYSFDEIGNVSRGARLGFDRLGRLVASRSGACSVLNDTVWISLADKVAGDTSMQRLVFGPDGTVYHSAFGQWGIAVLRDGRLRPRFEAPESTPKWVQTADFGEIEVVSTGVYFASSNGIVYWDRAHDRHVFIAVPNLTRLFTIADRPYILSSSLGLCRLDADGQQLLPMPEFPARATDIDRVTPFDRTKVLVSTANGRLAFFDGHRFTPFPGPLGEQARGRVTALVRMVDGKIAAAISGVGLYFVAETGQILSALTTPDYHRITDMASREKGVLWIVTESGIEKLHYDTPLTIFGQRLGLPVSWPQITRWGNGYLVASSGRLYESVPGQPGETVRFQPVADQPASEIWGLATMGEQLLVGSNQGVFSRLPGQPFQPILPDIHVARLLRVDDLLYVIGTQEIAALRWIDGTWRECAPRVAGVGYPYVAHATAHAAWLELGPNRVARVRWADGRLHVRLFEDFPWKERHWVNVGFIGDTVALSGMPEGRIYFDERTEALIPQPALDQLLNRSPYLILRFRQDPQGVIWATHDDGIVTFQQRNGQLVMDATTYGLINDRFPILQMLEDGEVWLSTGQSLYHANKQLNESVRSAGRPVLVSFMDGRTNRELLSPHGAFPAPLRLRYEQNNLVLRFFAGSYALRRSPTYEYRLHRGRENWVAVGNGSLLTLPDLREGAYRLEAFLTDVPESFGEPMVLEFEIAAPWYRTWYAYTLYAATALGVILGLMRWSERRSRLRNLELEKLMAERTAELRRTMEKLNEETRHAATLAERGRLAGEIHDSLQQGLSGLMLQLDATLKLPGLSPDVRTRLTVARNMVSFTRHEVQHAVWDMETPILEGAELGEALTKIASLIGPGTAEVKFRLTGQPFPLSSATKHHLLRIAQEAITNAVRHAAAKTITITLAYAAEGVTLQITDDGNGFVPSEVLANGIGHFGLRGLRGRASKINGELSIQSAPGCGTTVQVRVQAGVPVHSHER